MPLRAARDGFDALAFPALAEVARQELRASGEHSGRRQAQPWDQLTPQELQIAQMAADGLSNRDIGEKLYISRKTVAYHLNKTFAKLASDLPRPTLRRAHRDPLSNLLVSGQNQPRHAVSSYRANGPACDQTYEGVQRRREKAGKP